MTKLNNKRILIFQQRGWGRAVGHFLAKKLQADGAKLAAITLKSSTHKFVLDQSEVKYDLIINNDQLIADPKKYLGKDDYSLAEICQALGVDSIWPLISTLRLHVKSYKDKYYYGFKQNLSDEEIVDYAKAVFKCVKITFDKFNPEIIVTPNFVDLLHIMFNLYAKQHGVKMFSLTSSKIGGNYIFTHSFYEDQGPFYDRVDELNKNSKQTTNRQLAQNFIQKFRQKFKQQDFAIEVNKKEPLKKRVRAVLSPYYHIYRWYRKKSTNYLPNIGVSVDYKPPHIILRDHYTAKRYKKFMNNFEYYPFDKIDRCIYFPLQVQPEATIDTIATYYSNQIEMIRLAAMSLPDDYTLVVKEHPGMVDARPPSYIQKIARTPNVKLVDYRIPTEDVLRKTDLIISVGGTTLFEGAFYNIPGIQLGNLGVTAKLPNVFLHSDMSTIHKKIKQVLIEKLDTQEYEQKLENYVAAVYDTGVTVDYTSAWRKGQHGTADMDKLYVTYRGEIERNLL